MGDSSRVNTNPHDTEYSWIKKIIVCSIHPPLLLTLTLCRPHNRQLGRRSQVQWHSRGGGGEKKKKIGHGFMLTPAFLFLWCLYAPRPEYMGLTAKEGTMKEHTEDDFCKTASWAPFSGFQTLNVPSPPEETTWPFWRLHAEETYLGRGGVKLGNLWNKKNQINSVGWQHTIGKCIKKNKKVQNQLCWLTTHEGWEQQNSQSPFL